MPSKGEVSKNDNILKKPPLNNPTTDREFLCSIPLFAYQNYHFVGSGATDNQGSPGLALSWTNAA